MINFSTLPAPWMPALLLSSVLIGCAAENSTIPASAQLSGWAILRFGMSFDDAVNSVGGIEWNSVSYSECLQRMALDGCYLTADRERSRPILTEGVPLFPSIKFNTRGQLTDVIVQYRQEGNVTRAQCRDVHERTLDRLVTENGSFRFPMWEGVDRRTSKGAQYRISETRTGFVTVPMRSHWTGAGQSESRPITVWNDGPFVSLLSTLITVDGTLYCNVTIMYDAPKSMERAP